MANSLSVKLKRSISYGLAFNGNLNESLFKKDNMCTKRKWLISVNKHKVSEGTMSNYSWFLKMNYLNNDSGLKVGFYNINGLSEQNSREDFFLKPI